MGRRTVLFFALAAASLCAQVLPALEINGRVIEPDLEIGVVAAEVTLIEFAVIDHTVTRVTFGTAFTGSDGTFRFQPVRLGDYYVEVRKEGYQGVGPLGGDVAAYTEASVSLSRERPTQQLFFRMVRLGQITGRVLDEKRQPLGRLNVFIQPRTGGGLQTTTTKEDGSFTISKVPPGEYLVRIFNAAGPGDRVRTSFSPADIDVVEQELEETYWPGGRSSPSGDFLRVSPGATASIGTVVVAGTVPRYRAHVSAHGNCGPGERGRLLVANSSESTSPIFPELMSAACAPEFLVSLRPGSYIFMLDTPAPARWALAPVTITSRNVELDVTLSPAVDIGGRLLAAERAQLPPLSGLEVRTTPMGIPLGLGSSQAVIQGASAFVMKNVLWPSHRVRIEGLDPKFYIKEMRYGGRVVEQGIISVVPGAELEIFIDDKAASISGSVTSGDKLAQDAVVIAMRWPLPPPQLFTDFDHSDAIRQGRFQLGGMAPGEYRIIAVPSQDRARLRDWTVLNQFLSRVESTRLGPSEARALTVKLVE